MPAPVTAWFYIVTEESKPILKKVFEKGVRPGAVIPMEPEEFEILREYVMCLPVAVREDQKIITVPLAS